MATKAVKPDKKYPCCQCGEELLLTRFNKSCSRLYAGIGHLPICKDCLSREYKKYTIEYRNDEKAMQRICMLFDIYFNSAVFHKCNQSEDVVLGNYMKQLNLGQHKGKTFDATIKEGFFFKGTKGNVELGALDDGDDPVDPHIVDKWGAGLTRSDYDALERHYRYLKTANPNCDSNQEIFINDLCYTKMQQMRAVRENRTGDYNTMTESYRKTFMQAGLKTIQDMSTNNEDCWGIWQERIAQYTPEEYYKNKKLYRDFDGIGEYFERFVLRPLRNLMHGYQDRDPEYCVLDADEHDIEYTEAE